jgi:single-strand selective monofunctional uracil DNA glycosylase
MRVYRSGVSAKDLVRISRAESRALRGLRFSPPVTHVHDPFTYAREPWERYLARWATAPKELVLLGMNPGPFGMAQTGVPFGDVAMVRDFLGVTGAVERPVDEHPARPVLGFETKRAEVSGTRLWGWIRDRFGTAEAFFARGFVLNWCPLLFLEASGKNRAPDALPRHERAPLEAICDQALRQSIEVLQPRLVVGVGQFAEKRARIALEGLDVDIGCIPHPSPASPQANRGWAALADAGLDALGVGSSPARRP